MAFGLLTLMRAFVVDVYSVPSPSMEPTLQAGSRILVLTWPWQREAEPDDVVVVDGRGTLAPESPDSVGRAAAWLVGVDAGDVFVKRIAAVGPGRISCDGAHGPLTFDGSEAPVEFADDCGSQRFDSTVPAGRMWLMGDNRENSADSRGLLGAPGGGTVSEKRIVGRVIAAW